MTTPNTRYGNRKNSSKGVSVWPKRGAGKPTKSASAEAAVLQRAKVVRLKMKGPGKLVSYPTQLFRLFGIISPPFQVDPRIDGLVRTTNLVAAD
jgi:hypothetical protein